MAKHPRPMRSKPPFTRPRLLMAVGFRDQTHRITFQPLSDPETGAMGWELVTDQRADCALVYVVPYFDKNIVEIRCHVTDDNYPDPEHDELLGTVSIPPALFEPDETD